MKKKLITLLSFICFWGINLDAQKQNQINENIINTSSRDSLYVKELNRIALDLLPQFTDSAKAITNIALSYAEKLDYPKGVGKSYRILGIIEYLSGNLDNSLDLYHKSHKVYQSTGDIKEIAKSLNNLGVVYRELGFHRKALRFLLNALNIKSRYKNDKTILNTYNNIGNSYFELNQIDSAHYYMTKFLEASIAHKDLEHEYQAYNNLGALNFHIANHEKGIGYYLKALNIASQIKDESNISAVLLNIASVSAREGYYEFSENCVARALKINKEKGGNNINMQITAYTILGNMYMQRNKHMHALNIFSKVLTLSLKTNRIPSAIATMINISSIYNQIGQYDKGLEVCNTADSLCQTIGDKTHLAFIYRNKSEIYINQRKYKEALNYSLEGYKLSKELQLVEGIADNAKNLSWIYEKESKFLHAYNYLKEHKLFSDSIENLERSEYVNKMQSKIILERKEKELQIENEKRAAEFQSNLKYERNLRNMSILGGVTLLIFSIYVFTNYRSKTKINKDLVAKNKIIENQTERLAASIEYAQKIQSAIMPNEKILKKNFSDYFILNKPKDNISGDFYWLKEYEDHLYFAVADCTGHGVPGAFLSMLGITFLSDIVSANRFKDPGLILNVLRAKFKSTLNQEDQSKGVSDGMDIALCILNKKTNELKFAGAKHPLHVIRNNNSLPNISIPSRLKVFNNNGHIMLVLKADFQPVSISQNETNFITNSIELEKGDTIYLASDGYASQLGIGNQKYMTNRFRELLLQICEEPMDQQRSVLVEKFERWKSSQLQTDDVLALGLKL